MTPLVVDGPLGRWTHAGCRPRQLAGLVEGLWLFDGMLVNRRERTFPNGMLELFVHLGDRYRVVEDRGTAQSWICPDVCVTGLQLGPLVVEAPPWRTRVLGIKLTPAGAYALFARPMHEMTALTVDLRDLVGPAASQLADACNDAPSIPACLRAALGWLERRFTRASGPDPSIAWMLSEIEGRRGAVSIGALRERTGFSKSRLAVTFQEQVGVSAKHYARLVRFRRVVTALHSDAHPLLAQVAVDAGYYDQPHMNAEFRELGGMTPGEYLTSRRYPNSASVAEA